MRKQLEQQVVTGKSVKVKEEVHEVCDIEHKSVIDTDTKLCNINSEDLQLICESNEEAQIETIVFSKMNDKFPLWYYQPKVVSLYIYALKV